jgi:MoxR-like ATPase
MPTDKTAEALRILAEAFGNGGAVNADKVREIVTAELAKLDRPRTIEIKIADKPIVPIDGDAHHMLPTVLAFLVNGVHTMIVGPAGSGKTTLAMQCAKQMNLDFYAVSSIKQEYKLLGFTDAKGITHSTQFRKACEFGGLLLWDEIDASNADVLPIVHSAMENGFIDFPDCRVAIHKDFICLAAANTFGHGATRQYIGRNALDGATLDRYAVLDMGYDETLERKLAQNDEWTKLVQKYRHACDALGIKHIISPRASIKGARLLAAGIDRETVLKAMVWKGLAAEQVQKIIANARS